MINIRPFASLGHADHGWLNARHHFSFADYHDPERMGWGAIRVWNDDEIAPNTGFPPHPHMNMEIVTYVREGAITHGDSLGNKGRTAAGDVQVMSAGDGIRHSEFNLEPVKTSLFQIWIIPDERGGTPRWDQREFPREQANGAWTLLASQHGGDGTLMIRADARVWGAKAGTGQHLHYTANPARHLYLVSHAAPVRINGQLAQPRDGIAITDEAELQVEVLGDTELVLVDAI
jgi:redox-sensitive bicupin YhaK (pirin superfamily)